MGFFSDIERELRNFGGGLAEVGKDILGGLGSAYNDIAEAIARPLGVHPDVVKVAAAALGMYHTAGGGFVDAAGEAVSEAAAADLVAAHGAEALAASNQMAAAAELAAATGTALPYGVDPAMLASQLAAEGSIASAAHIASTAGVSTTPIVQNLIAAGNYDAALSLTEATNPMNLGFVNRDIGLAKTAAETATAFPVATSPLAPMSTYTAAELAALDAGLGGVSGAGAGANALAPTAAATGVNVANALSPEALAALDAGLGGVPASAAGTAALSPEALAALDAGLGGVPASAATGAGAAGAGAAGAGTVAPALNFEQIAAESLGANLPGAATGVSGSSVFTPATTATTAVTNALAPALNHEQIAAESLGANLPGAATGVAGAATVAGLSTGAFDALAKFAKDYGVPLASLISGITGSQAAKDAANVQAESAREARALAKQIFDEQKALQEPFRTAGITAQNQLLTLLGLPGGTQGAEFGRYARPFGMQDFQADPGYAFRLSEGLKALEASRAAKGGLLSGATGKALSRYGQDLASQEYGNAFNRYQTERVNRLQPLGALMGAGQAAAAGQAGYAGQYGQTAGGLTTDIGAARAAGDVGAANAITNALGQYARYASSQSLANQIRQSLYGPAIPV